MDPPAPDIQFTPPSPTPSMESFDMAPSNAEEWGLIPYLFNCSRLSAIVGDGLSSQLKEMASIRLPEYHLLVDHSLGVVWKSLCNGHKDIGSMTAGQLIWAIKFIESHLNRKSPYSEDMRMLLQYLQEVVVAMCSDGVRESDEVVESADLSLLSAEPLSLPESSFVLANMTSRTLQPSVPSITLAPMAASTPLVPPKLITDSTPMAASTPLPTKSKEPSALSASVNELLRNLEELHKMLVRYKNDQLRRVDIDVEQLDAIERLLLEMADTDQSLDAPEPLEQEQNASVEDKGTDQIDSSPPEKEPEVVASNESAKSSH